MRVFPAIMLGRMSWWGPPIKSFSLCSVLFSYTRDPFCGCVVEISEGGIKCCAVMLLV